MAFAKIAAAAGKGATSAIDTTGADLLIAAVGGESGSFSDSKGNTWIALTSYTNTGYQRSTLFYCYGPTVGAGHTFSYSLSYGEVSVLAVSGAAAAPFFAENGATINSGATLATGNVTPSVDGSLIVAHVNHGNNTTFSGVDSGFTIDAGIPSIVNVQWGGSIAHLIQSTAAAVNPIFTIDVTTVIAASIAVFTPAASGGGSTNLTGDNCTQSNTSSAAAIGQTHTLTGADSTQSNTSSTAGIDQTHILTGSDSTQTNTSDTAAIGQTHVLAGADSTQANSSDTASIGQTHILIGADSTQSNTSSTGSIVTDGTVFLTGADCVQANTCTGGEIGQTHTLYGGDCSQANTSGTASIGQTHLLTGASCTQSNSSSVAAIIADGTINLTGANATQINTSGAAAIGQTHILSGANCIQINTSSTGAIGMENPYAEIAEFSLAIVQQPLFRLATGNQKTMNLKITQSLTFNLGL